MCFPLLLLIDSVEKRLSCSDADAINDNEFMIFFPFRWIGGCAACWSCAKEEKRYLTFGFLVQFFSIIKRLFFRSQNPNSQELLFYLTGELTKQKMPNVENLR